MSPVEAELVSIAPVPGLWDQVQSVAPLVVVGTREPDGGVDLAPKHMATPMGWGPYFGFVCAPRHATYRNVLRERAFTVSWPRPDQVVLAALAAAPRCADGTKPSLRALRTRPARVVDGELLEAGRFFVECELERTVEGLGDNALVIGRVVAAAAEAGALRADDKDDAELMAEHPLLAYVHPDRFTAVASAESIPLPDGSRR